MPFQHPQALYHQNPVLLSRLIWIYLKYEICLSPHQCRGRPYGCPSDNRKKLAGFAQPASFRSYSIVATMNGEDYQHTEPYTVRRESQIRIPSGKFVFMDDYDCRSFNMGSWIFTYDEGGGHRFFDPIGVWHFKKGNFSYADGHTEMRSWKDYRTHQYAKYMVFGYSEDEITNDEACDGNPDVLFLANGFKAKAR